MIRIRILIFTRTDLDPTIVLRVHSFYMKLCLASLFFFTYSEPTNRTVSLVFFAYICPSIKCAKSLSLLEINKIHTVPVIYRFPL